MSLEAISGAVYQDTATVVKPRIDTTAGLENGAAALTITELTGASKVTTGSSTGKEQNSGQKDGQKDGTATDKQIKEAINKANNKLKLRKTNCEFSYHEETKRVSIKVIDSDTQEVIREIPPEETLQMVQKMWELAGILVDEKR